MPEKTKEKDWHQSDKEPTGNRKDDRDLQFRSQHSTELSKVAAEKSTFKERKKTKEVSQNKSKK